jgi:stage III sporulation protein AH
MLLKKQTVWLLTMLSLVVVLSVYYVTSEPKTSDLTAMDKVSQKAKNQGKTQVTADNKKNVKVDTTNATDTVFETIRMDRQDQYSKQKEELTNKLASTSLSAEERSKAADEMQQLTDNAQKEQVLESMIKSQGYSDALVEVDPGNEVHVTVKSKDHNKTAANNIVRLVTEEMKAAQNIAVVFQN